MCPFVRLLTQGTAHAFIECTSDTTKENQELRHSETMEFSLNRTANSRKLINHWSMSWAQFKDTVSPMCIAGAVVASWTPTQEVARWQVQVLFTVMTNIFVTEFSEFGENIQEKLE